MDSPGRSRSYVKRGTGEGSDGKNGKGMDDEEYEGHEKLKYKSKKSRKSSYGEEIDGWNGHGDRSKSSGDRNENRKQAGESSKVCSDEDDYGMRKESYSDKLKTKQEESTLEKLSNWYGDRELEINHDGGDKSGSRVHSRVDESEKSIARRAASKFTDTEGSQVRSKSKDERLHRDEHERAIDKDPSFSDRSGNSRAKLHGSSEPGNRRLDDSYTARNQEVSNYVDRTDSRSGKSQDPKYESIRERSTLRLETSEDKNKALESCVEKDKTYSREERTDADKTKRRSRYDAGDEDFKVGCVIRDDTSGRERSDANKEGCVIRDDTSGRDRSDKYKDGSVIRDDTSGRDRSDKYKDGSVIHDDTSGRERSDKYKDGSVIRDDISGRERRDKYKDGSVIHGDTSGRERSDKYKDGSAIRGDTSGRERNDKYKDGPVICDDTSGRERSDKDGSVIRDDTSGKERSNKDGSVIHDDTSGRERSDKYKENRATDNDASESRERPFNLEKDGRDKSGREIGHSRRSRTPERSGRYRNESQISDMDYDRSGSLKRKELDKEVYRDDRVKARDDRWGDRNKDKDESRENRKRMQPSSNDRDGDVVSDRDRERELPRYNRDKMDKERPLGRSGNKKEGRGEAVKASSNFGISTENYDVIEIQRKPLDYARENLQSSFARNNDVAQSEFKSAPSDARNDHHRTGAQGSASAGDALKEKYMDDGAPFPDQSTWKDDSDSQGGRLRGKKWQNSRSGSLTPVGNEEPGSQGRPLQQSMKGGRLGRANRIRPSGRDNQQANIPVHLMGPPFGPLSIPPPGQIQQLNPAMSPAPVPPMPPGVFIPPFSPPVWPGARGLDMSLLPISSGVSPIVPGLRFEPNIGTPLNPIMFFNQSGPGRGMPPNLPDSGFNTMLPVGRGHSHDKASGGWAPPKSNGPPGKAPSRGEQNDYSQNFVDTGNRPQNFIRELELTNVEDYPKLRELIQKKDEIVAKVASAPMYYKCDLKEFVLSPDFFGTKFDVILVDPPWEEYVHRAPGVTDNMNSWAFEEIMNLKIEAIADTPSFIFLWVGDGVGLEQGRQCLKKWGFRRCEDICWVKTNKQNATPALRHDSHTLFQHTKEHCLMGIKGTVRRSTDGHIIHANIDTDVIIADEPPYGSTAKPDEIYRIIEHFALGRRRLELFGEDHNIRSGWLTVGNGLSSSNFNSEAYLKNFADKDGKVWLGGGGRNPPPEAPHLVLTTPEIESLRPKSPMKNQQQLQQQSSSISLTANSSNRKPAGNSPQTTNPFMINQEGPGDHPPPWASMESFRERDTGTFGPHDNAFAAYGYNMPPHLLPNREFMDFDPQRTMNMM